MQHKSAFCVLETSLQCSQLLTEDHNLFQFWFYFLKTKSTIENFLLYNCVLQDSSVFRVGNRCIQGKQQHHQVCNLLLECHINSWEIERRQVNLRRQQMAAVCLQSHGRVFELCKLLTCMHLKDRLNFCLIVLY